MKLHRLLLAASLLPAVWALDDQAIVEWAKAKAVRLQTIEAGHGFADMQPLKKMVGDARIVSLGEATHGTREFFQLKHRMLEFLASEMGFTIFSIEANMPEAYRLNEFVLTGQGDPVKLIKGMYFWTWDTQEVLDMVLWMREFNKSGKGRIEFTGFDMQTPDVAIESAREFVAKADPEYTTRLVQAAEKAKASSRTSSSGQDFGFATGTFPAQDALGKRVRFSGYIKTKGVKNGYAGLWWRVDGDGKVLAFANLQDRAPRGTTEWQKYELEIPVAAGATNINFGALLAGEGTAWFDGLKVELDGVPYPGGSVFDFEFESPWPVGFHTGGASYQVELDSQVFHSGKQSLRMKKVASAPAEKSLDPKIAVEAWSGVVRHLDESREAYAKKKLSSAEIDWAIQNARVVVQCMQMRAGVVTRDRSMAENIKWILNHNPGAKIVLWAHNGHVGTFGMAGFEPMGAALRQMYGDQMVVFGFAFNQGSFQAMEQKSGLKNFTVPSAPPGSFDAMLAATGIPLFALDLRQAPKSGPVAEWLETSHKSRSIGAVYSEDTPYGWMMDLKAPQTFDVMLFVEKTTAARKN